MPGTLDLRRRWRRQSAVIVLSVLLTIAGIKAADHLDAGSGGDGASCPSDMAYVAAPGGGFCIDRFEASVAPGCPVIDPVSTADSRRNIDDPGCLPVSVSGASPWRYLSQNQAALACAKAGKRLPTDREWQAAALGTPDSAETPGPDDCLLAENRPGRPGLTGAGSGCRSPAGAYDLSGNVWEWTADTIDSGGFAGRQLPAEGYVLGIADDGLPALTGDSPSGDHYHDYLWLKNTAVRAVARGGYWDSREKGGIYAVYAVMEPGQGGTGIGFRCVR